MTLTGHSPTDLCACGREKHVEAKRCRPCYYSRAGSIEEQFWAKAERREPEACWPWKGTLNSTGYGTLYDRRTKSYVKAHRVSWELHNGPIPEGMFVCHHCDNPPCVNPAHLFVGTHRDNMRDMGAKRRNYTRPKSFCRICGLVAASNQLCVMHVRRWEKAGRPTPDDAAWATLAEISLRDPSRPRIWPVEHRDCPDCGRTVTRPALARHRRTHVVDSGKRERTAAGRSSIVWRAVE